MTIIGNFLRSVAKIFKGLKAEVKKVLPVAIEVVNGLKEIIENPISGSIVDFLLDYVKKVIPGEWDDALLEKVKIGLHVWLPKLLLKLNVLEEIDSITDPIEKAKKVEEALLIEIATITFSNDFEKQRFCRGLAQQLIVVFSDGKVTWSELGGLAEYVWLEKINN